jgi:hypothetical protein
MDRPEIETTAIAGPAAQRALMDLAACCPWRPPDWRVRLAGLRTRGVRSLRRLDDPWVGRCTRHLKRSCRRGGRGTRVPDGDDAVSRAFELHDALDTTRRLAVECGLLAGMTDEEIAARCGISRGGVAAYVAIFFDIRDRLDGTDYITFTAIDPEGTLSTGTPSRGVTARLLSYNGGPLVADAVLDHLAGGMVSGDGVAMGPSVFGSNSGPIGHLIDLLSLPITARNLPRLLRLHDKLEEIRYMEALETAGPVTPEIPFVPIDAPIMMVRPESVRASDTDRARVDTGDHRWPTVPRGIARPSPRDLKRLPLAETSPIPFRVAI